MLSGWVVTTRHPPRNLAHALLIVFLAGIISLSVDYKHYTTVVLKGRGGKSPVILDGG
jgi:hypothetical protein